MSDIEQLAGRGELFDDYYKLIRPLNTDGGTADVWLALDVRTVKSKKDIDEAHGLEESYLGSIGLLVAIKIYRPKNALDIEGEQKFRDEYTIVFNCHHTNLIHPTHYSIYKDTPYLVLPYCKKGSSELLVGSLTQEKDIWKYIFDVASGLAYLHNSCKPPIIHQDIKPANVLLDDYGNYAITDFGISVKHAGLYDDLDEINSGTFAYMAPERFNLDTEPSAESDIWAFGATLCELVTGKVPFGENGGSIQANGEKMEDLPKDLPKAIKNIITQCLSLNANKRPTAVQLAEEARKHLYDEKRFKYYYFIGFFMIFSALAAYFFWPSPKSSFSEDNVLETKTNDNLPTYGDAIQMLHSPQSASEGIKILDSLSNNGNAKASYVLSRIYFKGNWDSDNDAIEDSIKTFKRNLGEKFLSSSRQSSHELLKKCFQQDTTNYHVCYLLGLDYLGGTARQNGVNRNEKLAKEHFIKAKNMAQKCGNTSYADKIQEKLSQF